MGTATETLRHALSTLGQYVKKPKMTGLYEFTLFKGLPLQT